MAPSEVIVVGAGPAGAALALRLAALGRRVTVLDRAHFPRDKVCGEALSPGALTHLAALGVREAVMAAGAAPYYGLRLVAPGGATAEARYPAGAAGYTLSRVALDAALLEAARAAPGVTVREGAVVAGLLREGEAVTGVRLRDGTELPARLVVGADGRFSLVRRLAFGEAGAGGEAVRFCFLNTFEGARGDDAMLECGLVSPGLQYLRVYQGAGRYSVCLVVDEAERRRGEPGKPEGFLAMVGRLPRLAERVGGARLAGAMKGMPLTPYAPPRLVGPGVLLTGDAVGFMDPITGEGIYRALVGAEQAALTIASALAASPDGPLSAAALAPYEAFMRDTFGPVYRFVDLAVRLTTLPGWASSLLVGALGASPRLATAVASVQGALAPPDSLWRPSRWAA